MARLSRILGIALLVVHLMVGCCCAHGYENTHARLATHSDATLQGQCPECRCDHSHHGTRRCRGCNCPFVSPRRLVGGSSSPKCHASFSVLTNAHFPWLAISLHQDPWVTGRLPLPVRLHLANQVLLI